MSNIIESLNWRYACKAFDPEKKLSKEQVSTLLESLRLTASSYGLQPWKFVVVENKDLREQLVGASYNQRQVADASHLIVLCANTKVDEEFIDSYLQSTVDTRGGDIASMEGFKKMLMSVANKSDEQKLRWAQKQIYIALGNLMTVCADLKIDSCPMEGFSPKKYNEILGLQRKNLHATLVCPVGYRSKDDKYADLKKVRASIDDLTITI